MEERRSGGVQPPHFNPPLSPWVESVWSRICKPPAAYYSPYKPVLHCLLRAQFSTARGGGPLMIPPL